MQLLLAREALDRRHLVAVRLRREDEARADEDAESLPERVAQAASPIDDVRGTAAYRRHALRVLAGRALERVLT